MDFVVFPRLYNIPIRYNQVYNDSIIVRRNTGRTAREIGEHSLFLLPRFKNIDSCVYYHEYNWHTVYIFIMGENSATEDIYFMKWHEWARFRRHGEKEDFSIRWQECGF